MHLASVVQEVDHEFCQEAVSFNLVNNHQRELLEWITVQSGKNFSGFVKSVLYAHMKGASGGESATPSSEVMDWVVDSGSVGDEDAMKDIL